MTLTDLTLVDARDGLRRRDFTAIELTDAHLAAINALNPRLNAYITVTAKGARAQAAAADARLMAGDTAPLLGVPLAIKDLFCTAGVRTTAGSRILEPFVPPYESTVTANLLRDGAVFLGKANLDEFAMGSSTTSSAFGATTNPWTRADGAALVPGRVVGRVGGGGGGAYGAGGHRDRHGRVDPAAGGLLRHRGDQADLWPLLPLRDRGLCVVARPGRPGGADGGGLCGAAGQHGRVRPAGQHERRPPGAGLRRRLRPRRARPAHRRAARIPQRPHARRDRSHVAAGPCLVEGRRRHHRPTCPCRTRSTGSPPTTSSAPAEASSNLARYDGVRFWPSRARRGPDRAV